MPDPSEGMMQRMLKSLDDLLVTRAGLTSSETHVIDKIIDLYMDHLVKEGPKKEYMGDENEGLREQIRILQQLPNFRTKFTSCGLDTTKIDEIVAARLACLKEDLKKPWIFVSIYRTQAIGRHLIRELLV